jgi:hypothetical protein
MRSNSTDDLYPFFGDHGGTSSALAVTGDLWYRRLGHPNSAALSHIPLVFLPQCNNNNKTISFCDVC